MSTPTPKSNESEAQFCVRAHRALMDAIPDWRERNEAVWDAWDSKRGPGLAQKLGEKNFPPDRFSLSAGHCYFIEHDKQSVDASGNRVDDNVGLRDLIQILNDNNHRVLERECFQAITKGHTSDKRSDAEPEVMGFAGPYRLGMVGRSDPKFAIFGTEYHDREFEAELRQRPRRSVELLRLRGTGERFFDPIAALGANAPRLAMPAKYSAQFDSDVVESRICFEADVAERYSAPAFASGSNTYTPDVFDASGDEPIEGNMVSNEDLKQIVQAISELPEIQFIREQMQGGAGGGAAGGLAAGGAGGGMPMDDGGPEGASGPDGNPGGGGGVPSNLAPAQEDNQYWAMRDAELQRYQAEVAAFRRDNEQLKASMQQLAQTTRQFGREKEDARRRPRIEQIVQRYGGLFDAEVELKRTLYSAGSEMTPEQFDAYVADREAVGSRSQPMRAAPIPQGVFANTTESPEKFAAAHDLAMQLHTEAVNSGDYDGKSYAQFFEEAKQRLAK